MIDNFFLFVEVLIFSFLLSYVSYYLSYGLDRMMNYGGIFDFIRFNRFKYYAKEIGREDLILLAKNPKVDETSKKTVIIQISSHRQRFYNIVAAYSKGFKKWICVECMSVRICILLNVLILGFIKEYYLIIPTLIISIAIIYNFLNNAEE